MPKYTMTYPTLCKKIGVSPDKGLQLIAHAADQVEFCQTIRDTYGLDLTLQQATDIYETAPLSD
jgi:hypothetical protein